MYISPEVMVKFTKRAIGHFVTLIEVGAYLTECNPGDIRKSRNTC